MLNKALLVHLPIVLLACGGCYSNRALIDPYRFAPKNSSVSWQAPTAADQPPTLQPPTLPPQDLPLTLAELVDLALRNNTQTQQTWAQAREAAAQYAQSQSPDLPALSGTAAYQHQRDASVTQGGGSVSQGISGSSGSSSVTGTSISSSSGSSVTPFYFTQFGPQLALTYTLLDFGQQRATSEAARQALYFSNWTHNRAIQTLVQTISVDYYNYLYQKQLLNSYVADMETAQLTLDVASLSLNMGVKDMSDFLQARTQLMQKKTQWAAQRQEVQNTFASLLNDMGLPANQAFSVQDLPEVSPSKEMLLDVESLISKALQLRPDLLAAKADLLSKQQSLKAAQRAYFPTLQYEFDFGKTYYGDGLNDNYDFTSQVTLNIPIFSGFHDRNGVRLAEATKEESQATLQQVELSVIKDVSTAHYNVKIAFETIHYANDFLKAAKEQYEVALKKYRTGTNTILDVVSAQSSLADARATQASALQQWFTSLASLAYATGVLSEPLNPKELP